jgi:hypothetical protein
MHDHDAMMQNIATCRNAGGASVKNARADLAAREIAPARQGRRQRNENVLASACSGNRATRLVRARRKSGTSRDASVCDPRIGTASSEGITRRTIALAHCATSARLGRAFLRGWRRPDSRALRTSAGTPAPESAGVRDRVYARPSRPGHGVLGARILRGVEGVDGALGSSVDDLERHDILWPFARSFRPAIHGDELARADATLEQRCNHGVGSLESKPGTLSRRDPTLDLDEPAADGTVAIDMDPLSLLCRLAAAVPPPSFARSSCRHERSKTRAKRPRSAPAKVRLARRLCRRRAA